MVTVEAKWLFYSLCWTAVFEWYSCFEAGRVSVEDEKHSGRPSTHKTTDNVEKVWELICKDRRQNNNFHGAFEPWRRYGIAVYVPKESVFEGDGIQNWVNYANIYFFT
jgi:hypothetical protein